MDLILILLILIVPAIAQIKVTNTYNRLKKENNSKELTGAEVARKILDKNDLKDVYVVETSGTLSDYYDTSRNVVKLSHDIFNNSSIAALGIAAHECGHAIQDKEGYFYMRFRSAIYPVVRICTSISYFIILLGFLFQALKMVYIGIAFVGFGLIFQLITLPVEFNASKRAEEELKNLKLENDLEESDVKDILNAAAMTYVAGVLASSLQLIRLIFAFGDNNRR